MRILFALTLAAFGLFAAVDPVSARPAHAGPNECDLAVSDNEVAVGEPITVTVTGCPTSGNRATYLSLDGSIGADYGPLGYGAPFTGGVVAEAVYPAPGTYFVIVTECTRGRCYNSAVAILTVT